MSTMGISEISLGVYTVATLETKYVTFTDFLGGSVTFPLYHAVAIIPSPYEALPPGYKVTRTVLVSGFSWAILTTRRDGTYNLVSNLIYWTGSANEIVPGTTLDVRVGTGYSSSVYLSFEVFGIPIPVIGFVNKPNYRDLVGGYTLDSRSVPDFPKIKSPVTKEVTISYYRENKLEQIPRLKTISWFVYKLSLIENKDYFLPIVDCVLGTLYCNEPGILSLLSSLPTLPGYYNWDHLLPESIATLFSYWQSLVPPTPSGSIVYSENIILRKIAANNNIWNNATFGSDINPDPTHPMFVFDVGRAYFNYLMPVTDGVGNLIMEGPHTKEIHAALNAGLYALNPETNLPRVDNLGWRIQRSNEVLGIRVKADGTIDEELEKTTNRRTHADGSEANNIQEYNPNCFGSQGMLLRILPNKFTRNGTRAGGYSKVRDLPQMMAELHEQANAAMGYQEGTAIEIKLDGKTYRYPNQLALLTELFVTAKQTATYSKGAFFSSIVGEQSIKEVMAGLGLRTVDKFLEFKVAGQVAKLYYKGVSASQSIGRQLSAISTNIGTIIGNII